MTDPGHRGIDVASLDAAATYKLLSGAVVPRPIAWVSSLGPGDIVNLAPFSCYTFVSTVPPLVAISCGRRAGRSKDTAANAVARGEFVLNVPHRGLLEQVHRSSAEHPRDTSEADLLAIRTIPSATMKTPTVAEARVAFECLTEQVIEFGTLRTQLLVGRVVHARVAEHCLADGRILTRELDPICRLGGPYYADLGDIHYLEPMAEYFQAQPPGDAD